MQPLTTPQIGQLEWNTFLDGTSVTRYFDHYLIIIFLFRIKICLKLSWYKVFVHGTLQLLNFAMHSVVKVFTKNTPNVSWAIQNNLWAYWLLTTFCFDLYRKMKMKDLISNRNLRATNYLLSFYWQIRYSKELNQG